MSIKVKLILLTCSISLSSNLFAQQWVLDEIAEEQSDSPEITFPGFILLLIIIGLGTIIFKCFHKTTDEPDQSEVNENEDFNDYNDFDEPDEIDIIDAQRLSDDILSRDNLSQNKTRNYNSTDKSIANNSSSSTKTTTNASCSMEAVDLGLSVLWSSCNLGANLPEEYGNYYAWGEITPSETWKSGLVYNLENKQPEELKALFGNESFSFSGNPQYDAASKKLGEGWRIPTLAELKELFEKCTWELTTVKTIKGYKVTGPNGNTIFIPLAGNWCIDHPIMCGECSGLYSSDAYTGYHIPGTEFAYYLLLQPLDPPYDSKITSCGRSIEQTIRPVKNKN